MDSKEIALQLTLKAIETKHVHLHLYKEADNERAEKANEFNAIQISKFYNDILNRISDSK